MKIFWFQQESLQYLMIWFLFFWRVEPVKSRQLAHVATNQAELWWQASLCIFLTLGSWLARGFLLGKGLNFVKTHACLFTLRQQHLLMSPFVDAICLVIGPKSKLLVHSAAYSAASRSTKKWLSSCRSARRLRMKSLWIIERRGAVPGTCLAFSSSFFFLKNTVKVLNPNHACQSYVTLIQKTAIKI